LPHKSVTERLSEHLHYHLQARNSDASAKKQQIQGKSLSVPLNNVSNNSSNYGSNLASTSDSFHSTRKQLCRTRSNAPAESNATSSSTQHLVPQQKLGSPYMLPPNAASCWDTSPTMIPPHIPSMNPQHFLKSHSIENIPREAYHQNYWGQGQSSAQPDSQQDSDINLHKKLARQLTLNPAGCDPRLFQMQQQFEQGGRYRIPPNTLAVPSAHSPNDHFQQQLSPHKPLTPSSSGCQSQQHSPYEMHQVRNFCELNKKKINKPVHRIFKCQDSNLGPLKFSQPLN
jgi:hypothetical protein